MGPGFFPLDEELALLPGNLTARLQEALVRLRKEQPSFAKAARALTFFTGTTVQPDTARRRSEAAGALLLAYETAEAARILREHPTPLPGPATLVFGVDGAMVPIVGGQWMEVRTLAVGAVQLGSGMVESGNKLVVEERLKGSGMHWVEQNVNPMLALRKACCKERWQESWLLIEREMRREVAVRGLERRASRQVEAAPQPAASVVPKVTSTGVSDVPASEPTTKPPHPWKGAWSIRRQRELADAA